jgi:hypothetical protein
MDDPAYEYDTTVAITRVDVVLSEYRSSDHSTELEGWYDSEIFPDGPGEMNYFDDSPADDDWILTVNGEGGNDTVVVNNWTLRFYSGGSYTDISGGSFALEVSDNQEADTIAVTGIGTADSVECYLDITAGSFMESVYVGWWFWGHWENQLHQTEIGEVSVILDGPCIDIDITPAYLGSRMQSALLVIHSLLDANADGFITEDDEYELPVKIGQGCHASFFSGSVFVPDDSYTYDGGGWVTYPASQYYDETTEGWYNLPNATLTMETDTLGSHFADIWSHVNSTSTGGYTPNGMLIGHAVDYISSYKTAHPDLWCMQQNIVLITDGLSNGPRETCDPTASGDFNYEAGGKDLVRECYRAWHEDSIRVFAVGFGTSIDEDGRRQLNWASRWGGTCANPSGVSGNPDTVNPSSGCPTIDPQDAPLTGYAYIADDANALAGALQEIFQQISGQGEKGFSSAEVTSIEEDYAASEYQARMFLASFFPDEDALWEGHLRSVELVAGLSLSFSYIPDSLVIWDAGDLLRDRNPSDRNIYGIKGGNLLEFSASNFDSFDLDVASSEDAEDVINLVRGGSTDSSDTAYLGDIFHSAPLLIGSSNFEYHDDGFDEFRDSMLYRRPFTIYAGSNTGLLHAFLDADGSELFAVVPKNFTDEVKALRDSHRFFVDANPMAADVWFPSSSTDTFKEWNEWKTVLMAAQGEGGRCITCLDVTNPANPSYLFSFESDTMGLTTSVPHICKVGVEVGADTVRDRFFAFFGGGECPDSLYDIYDPTGSGTLRGNVIVAVDIHDAYSRGLIKDGNFWFIPPASGDADKMVYPFPSATGLVNLNSQEDTRFDLLYIPDFAGQLWKVDITDTDISSWEAKCIFQPPIPADSSEDSLWQPAFYPPELEKEPATGALWVFYGTGDRSKVFKHNTDNRFYAVLDPIRDTLATYPITESDLKRIWTQGPFVFPDDFSSYKGWYIVYSDSSGHSEEKTVSQASLFKDTLSFVTFEPTREATDCEMAAGGAREYSVNLRTGGGRYKSLGAGIPQAPRVSLDRDGSVYRVHQTSDSLWVDPPLSVGALRRIFKWRER